MLFLSSRMKKQETKQTCGDEYFSTMLQENNMLQKNNKEKLDIPAYYVILYLCC